MTKVNVVRYLRNIDYDTNVAEQLERSVLKFNLSAYESSLQYQQICEQANESQLILQDQFGIADNQFIRLYNDAYREGLISSKQPKSSGDFSLAVGDYLHAVNKRDAHKSLRRYGEESQSGILSVKPRYEHYAGMAGFIQQSHPNTASVPKALREYMVPADNRNMIVSVDLAQADWNWLQALTLSPSMEAASQSGDVYGFVGNYLANNGIDLTRQDVKKFVNSLNYGRTIQGLQREWDHIGYDYDAVEAVGLYRQAFPELAAFMRDVSRSRRPFLVDRFRTGISVPLRASQRAALPAQSGVAAFIKSYMVGIFAINPTWIACDCIRDMVIFETPSMSKTEVTNVAFRALDMAKKQYGINNAFEGNNALHVHISKENYHEYR